MSQVKERERGGRTRWQFRLRTLLVFVALAGPLLAMVGHRYRVHRERQEFIDAVTVLGGSVTVLPAPGPERNKWWREWVLADKVLIVDLHSKPVRNADLQRLIQLPGSRKVVLFCASHSKVSDAGFVYFQSLPILRELTMCSCQLTDDGLRHLHPVNSLRALGIRGTAVTRSGVLELKRVNPDCLVYRLQTLDPE
jgi:hypothetical protein